MLEEPWPWQSDPEGFKQFFKRTMVLYFLNAYVIATFGYSVFYLYDLDLAVDYSKDGVPTTTKMLA